MISNNTTDQEIKTEKKKYTEITAFCISILTPCPSPEEWTYRHVYLHLEVAFAEY